MKRGALRAPSCDRHRKRRRNFLSAPFGNDGGVRRDTEALARSAEGDTETGHDFIKDDQGAGFVSDPAQSGNELRIELWQPKVQGGLAPLVNSGIGWYDLLLNRTANPNGYSGPRYSRFR